MADNMTSSSLPPPPTTGAAMGQNHPNLQAQYEAGQHMPPPPVPSLTIPQNNGSIQSPGENGINLNDIMSPMSAGGFIRRAAPEPNKRALYVGGLDPRVTEDVLKQIFETTGHVQNVKIIPDKNVSSMRIFAPHTSDTQVTRSVWLRSCVFEYTMQS